MPSFCVIDSCKRVKQVGDTVSFHKFPINSKEIFEKWMLFVRNTSKNKSKIRNITKFSSICSQHFKSSDFSGNGTTTRRFLRKFAVPSIDVPTNNTSALQPTVEDKIMQSQPSQVSTSNNAPVQIILEEEEEEISMASYEFCGLCGCQSNCVMDLDDYNFSIMRKCLPFINFNLSLIQRVCNDCISILNTFSSFIDRVIVAQNILNDDIPRNIKVEPLLFEDDQILERINVNTQETTKYPLPQPPIPQRTRTSQEVRKKCEILEIVDIKQPLNFLPFQTNALSNEISDSNLIQNDQINAFEAPQSFMDTNVTNQILSPNQLKVEINDQDDEECCGDNELELIKNFVLQSSVYNHDHNYVKDNENENVKIKYEEEIQILSESIIPSTTFVPDNSSKRGYMKICCKKMFKSVKRYLIHKLMRHSIKNANAMANQKCIMCNQKFKTERSLRLHKHFHCKRYRKSQLMHKVGRNMYKFDLKVEQLETINEINSNQNITKKRRTRAKNNSSLNSNNQCSICFKVFKAAKNLYQHKTTHSEIKYHCSFCPKSFKMKHGLRQHIAAQHEKKRKYTCTICNHNYALKGDLKRCRHSDLKRKI